MVFGIKMKDFAKNVYTSPLGEKQKSKLQPQPNEMLKKEVHSGSKFLIKTKKLYRKVQPETSSRSNFKSKSSLSQYLSQVRIERWLHFNGAKIVLKRMLYLGIFILLIGLMYGFYHSKKDKALKVATTSVASKSVIDQNIQGMSKLKAATEPEFTFYHTLTTNQTATNADVSDVSSDKVVKKTDVTSQADQVSQVVQEEKSQKVSTPVAATVSVSKIVGYMVSAGIYSSKSEANALRAKLLLLGFKPLMRKEGVAYQLTLGPYQTEESAKSVISSIKSHKVASVQLIPLHEK